MTLSELAKNLHDAQSEANMDLSEVDPNCMVGWETRRAQANAALPFLVQDFIKLASENLAGIFIHGTPEAAKAFSEIAEDEGAAVTVNVNELYDRLTTATIGPNPTQVGLSGLEVGFFSQELAVLVQELGIQRIPQINVAALASVSYQNYGQLRTEIKRLVESVVGNELNGVYLRRSISFKALASDTVQNVVPVVVLDATPQEQEWLGSYLFAGTYVDVNVENPNVEKNVVISAFKKLKTAIKARRTNTNR